MCRLKIDVGPGFPIETNLYSMSPDIPSNQASSSITMEVGSSSTGAGIPDQTGDLANTATVGSTNFASDTKDDKQDHITSDFRNNWEEDHIIPLVRIELFLILYTYFRTIMSLIISEPMLSLCVRVCLALF